jgi:hypothetical protein
MKRWATTDKETWAAVRYRLLALGLAGALQLLSELVVRGEDHADYKHEVYAEDRGRMRIRTESAYFEKEFDARWALKGEFVYDGISGSTPTGRAPASPDTGASEVPKAYVWDIRRAGYLEPEFKWGRNLTALQLSYSEEHDYISHGLALNHSMNFNDKNTTVTLGAAQTWDTIQPLFWARNHYENKNSSDFLIGVNQLLSKYTVLTVNLTLGTSSGYLTDPYKSYYFTEYDFYAFSSSSPEQRPGHKTRQVLYVGLNQFFPKANGSADLSYRLSHDSYDIWSHTANVAWYQNATKYVVFSPSFRYYRQSQAYFYSLFAPYEVGDPQFNLNTDPVGAAGAGITSPFPSVYSSDYRLAALESYTFGVSAAIRVRKWFTIDLAYKRYIMSRLDNFSYTDAFPKAHVYTCGARFNF